MLKDYFSQISGKYSGRYGLEIETESMSHKDLAPLSMGSELDPETDKLVFTFPNLPEFVGHEDGSLRNYGMEFVFKRPLDLEDAESALDNFAKQTKTIPFILDPAAGSVHVHVNVSYMSLRQLGNLLFLWTLLENVMVSFCGDFRQTNLFALPTRCAESNVANIVQMFSGLDKENTRAINFSMETVKYAALNLSAISRFGSVEIRCLEGTTDVSRIKTWLRMIDRIVEYAMFSESPAHLLEEVKSSRTSIATLLLGDFLPEFTHPPDIYKMVSRNLWYAASIVESVESWDALEAKYPIKRKPSKKSVDMIFGSYADLLGMNQAQWGLALNTPQPTPAQVYQTIANQIIIDEIGYPSEETQF